MKWYVKLAQWIGRRLPNSYWDQVFAIACLACDGEYASDRLKKSIEDTRELFLGIRYDTEPLRFI